MNSYFLMSYEQPARELENALKERVVVLDGALGTMIQSFGLTEADFRGSYLPGHPLQLAGCNDLLSITRPDVIASIHRGYMEAGADIISTNSFNSNVISLAEYGLSSHAAATARAAAALARREADAFMAAHEGRRVWVGGSMGPGSKSLSMAGALPSEGEPFTFSVLAEAYREQAAALLEGGVDLILLETFFDSLNAKAAILGAMTAMEHAGRRVPFIISATLGENGRTLTGQTPQAFMAAVEHAEPLAVGFNCGFGAAQLLPFVSTLAAEPCAVSLYPNAGLPNELGGYDETPQTMAAALEPLLSGGALNIVGGCCGTTPAHIRAIAGAAAAGRPRPIPARNGHMRLSGLEVLEAPSQGGPFLKVGERCNVAGSRKFLRLIKEGALDEAVDVARSQVRAGAAVIDLNVDDAMLDARAEMGRFLERLAADPVTAAVPVMIDSSSFDVIAEGLTHLRGRGIVNSISLKEGEETFLKRAAAIRRMGCAVVVMAMDEAGQADTLERKMEVVRRAYSLLTSRLGFRPEEIIFDPNVLAVATGVPEHDGYGLAFIEASKAIKSEMPGVHVSGGISNLSFSFRGNNTVREAMHALFISLATGLDMGIVNPSAMKAPEAFPQELIEAVRPVLLHDPSVPEAVEALTALAGRISEQEQAAKAAKGATSAPAAAPDAGKAPQGPAALLTAMIVAGRHDGVEQPLQALVSEGLTPLQIVDGPLMEGMNRVGALFGEGRIFLPQVVRAAQAMKQAVAWLTPLMEAAKQAGTDDNAPGGTRGRAPRVVLATVKGDVHDIGKNIVAIILRCNGFEVDDMGVMVPPEKILARARETGADIIGLSGLITPSLHEMQRFALMMEEEGLEIPLFVGGAATSALHTAVRIAPGYHGQVFHTLDAARLPVVARRWLARETRAEAERENAESQELLRFANEHKTPLLTFAEACARAPRLTLTGYASPLPAGVKEWHLEPQEVAANINWRAFLTAWSLDASLASLTRVEGCDHCRAQWLASLPQERRAKGAEAMQLLKHARRELANLLALMDDDECGMRVRTVTTPAASVQEDILTLSPSGDTVTFPTLRQQGASGPECGERLSLADFVAPRTPSGEWPDSLTFFAVTAGKAIEARIASLRAQGRDYDAMVAQSLADRLAEAATETLHQAVSGGAGIRPAIGYTSMPDQSLVFEADKLLDYSAMGITLTENGALAPAASTTGFFIIRPEARYFTVGTVGPDQLASYTRRRGHAPCLR